MKVARKRKNTPNNLFLMPEIPEKYKSCPPDLVWAIPLAMAQETPLLRLRENGNFRFEFSY